ncbi:hypothetical protein [Methylobacterium haplocladii]|uniref:Uncharacterized protein n=1 Tax=Methylobacterium haplocladii TaxID=1176176 RepID=A0A512IK63_9HYPH|nr:hypothetical protein [Methylobacterium haplocladii]GEO98110.1 hypothetical protein MHA02_04980 [Methylobacterium haplocladii]GLS59039.1 hypothetical protein GCM10007887_17050 [Methylobacterium haplocladii]
MCGSTGSRATAWLVASLLLAGSAAFGPANAKPATQPAVSEAEKLKAIKTQGDKAQRSNEARQRLWDRKMKAVSGSICNGC